MAEHPDSEEGWENLIAIAIITLLAVGVGWWVYAQATAVPVIEQTRTALPIGASPTLGNGPLVVVIFSDFECPYCGQFARESFPAIKQEFVDTGKVTFVFKHFPIATHEHAQSAAVAAYCAQEQGKFWEYHDVLFSNQENLDIASLERYAQGLGLERESFLSCMNVSISAVLRDRTLGEQAGVTGTPTFFFNGRKVTGALSPDDFRRELAQE
jgi:protein-disulfide isomerase